jgi:hypothetical protein
MTELVGVILKLLLGNAPRKYVSRVDIWLTTVNLVVMFYGHLKVKYIDNNVEMKREKIYKYLIKNNIFKNVFIYYNIVT